MILNSSKDAKVAIKHKMIKILSDAVKISKKGSKTKLAPVNLFK